jgi:hypothetical protein
MAESFRDALFEAFAPDEIVSVFLKGSSRKHWDSPIDYVPEFSDVDIHVRFRDEPAPGHHYVSLDVSLRIQEALERGFRCRVPDPIHVPRVQFIPVNVLERDPLYVASPGSTVETLFGREYESAYIGEDAGRSRSRQLLLDQRPFLTDLGDHVADKPEHHLWDVLRQLPWRVGPAGPRVLELLDTPHVEAWSCNRSRVVRLLEERGQTALARHYTAFYLGAWNYFLSGRKDSGAGREVVRAAAGVLGEAIHVAEQS